MKNEYLNKGYSKKDAQVAAYKRDKVTKTLRNMVGLSVAAVSARALYKAYDGRVDKVIKQGKVLQRITSDSSKGVRDAFYFATSAIDKAKYKGHYGYQILTEHPAAYNKSISTKQAIKVASDKNATKALKELVKNDAEYAKALKKFNGDMAYKMQLSPQYAIRFKLAEKSLDKGKVNRNVYNMLNISATEHTPQSEHLHKRYYDHLSTKGYGAISDVNDKKFSGYRAKSPMIAFNVGDKIDVTDVRELDVDEILKNRKIGTAEVAVKNFAPYIVGGTIYEKNKELKKTNKREQQYDEIVNEYRKKHPGTRMSYNEILDNYYNK